MTRLDELNKMRQREAAIIKKSLESMREKTYEDVKEGPDVVAFVIIDQF